MSFLADIAHSFRNSPGIKTELAGTCRAEGVEEFVNFRSAHRSILSFRYCRYDGQLAGESIHHSLANKNDRLLGANSFTEGFTRRWLISAGANAEKLNCGKLKYAAFPES